MPSYYEAVGEEPTYELAEGIIKAFIRELRNNVDSVYDFQNTSGYLDYSREYLGYKRISRNILNTRKDLVSMLQIITKHFPNVLIKSDTSLYVKESTKHLLVANDLVVMDYYLILLNEYEERVNKYQRYLKKQQDSQRNKLLFVLFLPFILFVLMILVGDS